MATVITTITFQQAASPPGGVWPQSGNVTNKKIHPCMGRGHSQTQLLRFLRLKNNTIKEEMVEEFVETLELRR
ncbi:hypothetical protein CFP56_001342 [Quercus suber]|uniref:PGG domain-containing protein n=1 Tax=Quercus suber TaxID=58331 RepID=A0AAW0LGD6_QUESU